MTDNDKILERLHGVLLEILMEFDRICRKHNIQYFLDSGTALGAVRHGGFIPWDDDIDVGMLRSDYDRFMEIAPSEIGENFYLLHKGADSNYKREHAKLCKLGTVYPEEGTEGLKCRGIFIDLFPFDYISDNKSISHLEFILKRYATSRLRIRKADPHTQKGYQRLVCYLLKIVPLSWMKSLFTWSLLHHNKRKTNTVTCFLYHMCDRRDIVFPVSTLYPCKDVQFEGKVVRIMNDPHDYLTRMYRNYMELPPVEKREYHFEGEIIFD